MLRFKVEYQLTICQLLLDLICSKELSCFKWHINPRSQLVLSSAGGGMILILEYSIYHDKMCIKYIFGVADHTRSVQDISKS